MAKGSVKQLVVTMAIAANCAFLGTALPVASAQASTDVGRSALSQEEVTGIARDAYVYAYPLILMELTRRVGTNVTDLHQFGKAPINQFGNLPN
jgi:hypothetical protein